MAADGRPKCPVCQSPTRDGGWDTFRSLTKPLQYPSTPEQGRRRARAARIRQQNGAGAR